MNTVAFVARSSATWELDVGRGRVIAGSLGELRLLHAEASREPGEQVVPVLVVLVEDGDPRARLRLQHVAREYDPLGLVARDVADRPRIAPVVAPPRRRAARDEKLRHLRLVEKVARRQVGRGAEGVEDREDVVLLNQLADGLDRPRRVVAVVEHLVVDLPPVHAAARVGVGEVGSSAPRDGAGGGRLAGERRRPADQDRAGADARIGSRARQRDRRAEKPDHGEDAAHRGGGSISPAGRALLRDVHRGGNLGSTPN